MSYTISTHVDQTVTLVNGPATYPDYSFPLDITSTGGVYITAAGADAIDASTLATNLFGVNITNDGTVMAGAGQGSQTGGIGVDLSVFNNIVNNGTIDGGASVGESGVGVKAGGGYGVGGVGVSLVNGSLTNNKGAIVQGGYGYDGSSGGVGIVAHGARVYNYGTITGGAGNYQHPPGRTGTSGVGVELAAQPNGFQTYLLNAGSIYGGSIFDDNQVGAFSDNGGLGVEVGADTVFKNKGDVFGGAVGVEVRGGTVYNSGYIGSGVGGENLAAVDFESVTGGKLELEIPNSAGVSSSGIGGYISGFVAGDTVEIANLTPTQTAAAFYGGTDPVDPSKQFYGIKDNGSILFLGFSSASQFQLKADPNGGTDITVATAACFREGTRILTADGEVPVEALRIGDRVVTLNGQIQPIRWIGRRSFANAMVAADADALPVLIRAGALGVGVPRRDLWVSPEHAMYIDGVLIPAHVLVNGDSIVRDGNVAALKYFHLELDQHAVIHAEGALAESYVDDDSRDQFDNAAEYTLLYPHACRGSARFCAPRLEEGAQLEGIRRNLLPEVRRAPGTSSVHG